jgi:hypothetical protein
MAAIDPYISKLKILKDVPLAPIPQVIMYCISMIELINSESIQ